MIYLNHYIYNILNAYLYNISYDSFLVAKKWFSKNLFLDVVNIFRLNCFKSLSLENKKKMYEKINKLYEENIGDEAKRKWLITCREQLENLDEEMVLKRK